MNYTTFKFTAESTSGGYAQHELKVPLDHPSPSYALELILRALANRLENEYIRHAVAARMEAARDRNNVSNDN